MCEQKSEPNIAESSKHIIRLVVHTSDGFVRMHGTLFVTQIYKCCAASFWLLMLNTAAVPWYSVPRQTDWTWKSAHHCLSLHLCVYSVAIISRNGWIESLIRRCNFLSILGFFYCRTYIFGLNSYRRVIECENVLVGMKLGHQLIERKSRKFIRVFSLHSLHKCRIQKWWLTFVIATFCVMAVVGSCSCSTLWVTNDTYHFYALLSHSETSAYTYITHARTQNRNNRKVKTEKLKKKRRDE